MCPVLGQGAFHPPEIRPTAGDPVGSCGRLAEHLRLIVQAPAVLEAMLDAGVFHRVFA
jgi:hypothetical protein